MKIDVDVNLKEDVNLLRRIFLIAKMSKFLTIG